MKIYRIWQKVNNDYDTFDSAVVCAESEDEAKKMQPSFGSYEECLETADGFSSWCGLKDVQVEYLGEAKEGLSKSLICGSFNAG